MRLAGSGGAHAHAAADPLSGVALLGDGGEERGGDRGREGREGEGRRGDMGGGEGIEGEEMAGEGRGGGGHKRRRGDGRGDGEESKGEGGGKGRRRGGRGEGPACGVGLGNRWAFGEVRPPGDWGIYPPLQPRSRDHASCVSGKKNYQYSNNGVSNQPPALPPVLSSTNRKPFRAKTEKRLVFENRAFFPGPFTSHAPLVQKQIYIFRWGKKNACH